VTRTPYNQYESIILLLKSYIDKFSVDFLLKYTVTDLDFEDSEGITVSAIYYNENDKEEMLKLNKGDLCIVTKSHSFEYICIDDLDLKGR